MHGQTKELNRLVAASALDPGGEGDGGSRRAYRRILDELEAEHPEGARTRVVVDTIAGTSAGGINGIYLAKALAHNRSQDGLRNLWLDKGDVGLLMRGPRFLPWKLRLPGRLLRLRRETPLRGDSMSEWLFEALRAMDEQARPPGEPESLISADEVLQLFVTTTDFYGYRRAVVLTDPDPDPTIAPTPILEQRHRHVLEFRRDRGRDDFGRTDNVALAFSARATSCFPGAFPPVGLEAFEGYLRRLDARFPAELEAKYFRQYGLAAAAPRDAFFVDGGVLDNRPFGHAIEAVKRKRAEVEIDRRLLYLEPDPAASGPVATRAEPAPLATVLGAVSGIPRKEPVLDDLLAVAVFNDRVRRVRDVIEMSFAGIAKRVRELIAEPLAELPAEPGPETLGAWSAKASASAAKEAGLGYATYIRLKVVGVVDRYARAVWAAFAFTPDSDQAFFVRAVLRSWAEKDGLFEKATPPTPKQTEFLRDFDLEYGERRLRFVIAGLNWYYRDRAEGKSGYPEREELDGVKTRLYEAIETLDRAVAEIRDDAALAERLAACFDELELAAFAETHGLNPSRYAAEHERDLDGLHEALRAHFERRLSRFTPDLYRDLARLTAAWEGERRTDLLVRYLGFPFWDALLYPIEALAEVGERDHVQVVRMSPRDATLLGSEGEAKLAGISRHHFGAFFERAGRESDYLWGRLDGAERLIELLAGRDHPRFATWCTWAFEAVLAEEEAAEPPLAPSVLGSLRARVEALKGARGGE